MGALLHNHLHNLTVALNERSYHIAIGDGLLTQSGQLKNGIAGKHAIVISDENVAGYYAEKLLTALRNANITAECLSIAPGEASKSMENYQWLMNKLLSRAPDRKTTLIALGGGVVGDLTGFAASTLLRGVPFMQIPTSLLAQVDSSVGGKTGINSAYGKNLIGSFYQPVHVIIDLATLKTLPIREWRAGYAEIVKYGLIADAALFNRLEALGDAFFASTYQELAAIIHRCCAIKADIVAQDEREGDVRAFLNFGHTFGHALEAEMGFDGRLLHGEAVALGMVMGLRLSEKLELIDNTLRQRLAALLRNCGLATSPADIHSEWDINRLTHHCAQDKKAESGKLNFIGIKQLGQAVMCREISPQLVSDIFRESMTWTS